MNRTRLLLVCMAGLYAAYMLGCAALSTFGSGIGGAAAGNGSTVARRGAARLAAEVRKGAGDITCSELSGVWRTYELRPGRDPKMCGDTPCFGVDYSGPLEFECRDEKIVVTKTIMYASYPPPGRRVTAPVEVKLEGESLTLNYTDNLCPISYAVKLQDGKLVGEYSMEGCAGPRFRGSRGVFLATKWPDK